MIDQQLIRRNEIGTVSHGTLRTEDLLESFANELEHSVQRNAEAWCSDEGRKARDAFMNLIGDAREYDEAKDCVDEGSELVNELIDALDFFAPPESYFGTNEGDGSDFGYWPIEPDE